MKKLLILLLSTISILSYGQDEILIDGAPCGLHGSARLGTKEYDQNPFKNRYQFPQAGDFDTSINLEDLIASTAIKGKFSQAKAVEVTGYVYEVKKGGKETCNCKTNDPLFKDTHIELTLNDHETGANNRLIVEVTPRIRQIFADKGIDWTTEALKANLKGRMVKIQGWLFYDFSHETENFADDPEDNIGRANWRASSWEIHPVTSIEIMDDPYMFASSAISSNDYDAEIVPVTIATNPNNTSPIKKSNKMETPMDTLVLIILGAILGMVGQGIRVIVGIKKTADEATRIGTDQQNLIKTQQIVLSLFIAFAIGAVSGVLAAIGNTEPEFTKSTYIAFIAAGYAGTDFIEGFIRKNPSVSNNSGS